jgi:GDP-L-fucose synthase
MMKIFVTGAGGFLGTKLCKRLVTDGHEVTAPSSKYCNLLDQSSLNKFETVKYDQIFHLAAWTQAGDFCLKYPGDQWINNQKINSNVLSWWSENQNQAKLIFMGTSCAYSPDYELSEENYMKGEPIESLYTYAMTKRMLLQGARAIDKQKNLKWLCAVPSTLYGSDYHVDDRQMHFIFDLIRKILKGKKYGEKVILWGDGQQKREIIHIDDFIENLLEINKKLTNEIVNIGAGSELTIREFANEICKIVKYDSSQIVYDQNRYVGSKSKLLDTKKIEKYNHNYKNNLISLKDGLGDVIEWFLNNEILLQRNKSSN